MAVGAEGSGRRTGAPRLVRARPRSGAAGWAMRPTEVRLPSLGPERSSTGATPAPGAPGAPDLEAPPCEPPDARASRPLSPPSRSPPPPAVAAANRRPTTRPTHRGHRGRPRTTPPADDPEAAGEDADGPLTVYSGRSEELVGEILAGFTEATGHRARRPLRRHRRARRHHHQRGRGVPGRRLLRSGRRRARCAAGRGPARRASAANSSTASTLPSPPPTTGGSA